MGSKNKHVAPYGSWKSPITADLVSSSGVRLGEPVLDGANLYWLEGRPKEGGRQVIVRMDADGKVEDFSPKEMNARTLVHEYGGVPFEVKNDMLLFSNFADQKVYKIQPEQELKALTVGGDYRYADFAVDPLRSRIICVREDHTPKGLEANNTLVEFSSDSASIEQAGEVVVTGANFYSNPRFSPDGKHLCWLSWNHPNMPWDGTELWVADIDADGKLWKTYKVAGGPEESIFQPEWLPNGTLIFISDRSGFWNFYAIRDTLTAPEPVCLIERENDFGLPAWVFGMSSYCVVSNDKIICEYNNRGIWELCELRMDWHDKEFELHEIATDYTEFSSFSASGKRVVFIAGSASRGGAIIEMDADSHATKVVKTASDVQLDPKYISEAKPIEFPTENGLTAYAFYYPPKNADYEGEDKELPPLLVKSHGGPTGSTSSTLSLGIQYWTSRGFAVVDVNYGGSTGHGRDYRNRLKHNWGVVDVQDCENAAKYLTGKKKVDGNRLAITGGSAGGYTTLCALTFGNTFKAGASHFGVSDIEALMADTHKFESKYDTFLIGPMPEAADLIRARSPINSTDKLSCPIIFFQGLEDKVVLPNQSEMMVDALRAKKLPVAYITYEGEQHGFRKAENIKRTIEAEFYFYSRIFKFEPADDIEPVEIENLPTKAGKSSKK